MKTVEQLKPNHGPVYAAAMYPDLCPVFHRHGYALAVHGSLARDFDLIAVPWAEAASDPEAVLKDVTTAFAVRLIGGFERKRHGRVAQTISVGYGVCSVDLSFLPRDGAAGAMPAPRSDDEYEVTDAWLSRAGLLDAWARLFVEAGGKRVPARTRGELRRMCAAHRINFTEPV